MWPTRRIYPIFRNLAFSFIAQTFCQAYSIFQTSVRKDRATLKWEILMHSSSYVANLGYIKWIIKRIWAKSERETFYEWGDVGHVRNIHRLQRDIKCKVTGVLACNVPCLTLHAHSWAMVINDLLMELSTGHFLCFVDFASAFHFVCRDYLWRKPAANGIPAKLLRHIRAYYASTNVKVRASWALQCLF